MRRNSSGIADHTAEIKWDVRTQKAPGLCKKNKMTSGPACGSGSRQGMGRHAMLRNHTWSCHVIKAPTLYGRLVWIFTVVDEHTQECLLSFAGYCISNQNITDELFNLFLQRGIPKYLLSFSGGNSIPKALSEWIGELEINGTFVETKKYGDNGHGILFMKRFMKDLQDQKGFASLADVKLWLANWKHEYNRSIYFLKI